MIKAGVLSLFVGLLAMSAMAQSAPEPEPEVAADECPLWAAQILYKARQTIGTEATANQVFLMTERAREICTAQSITMAMAAQTYYDFALGSNDTEQAFMLFSKAYDAVHATTIATDADVSFSKGILTNLDGSRYELITEDFVVVMRQQVVFPLADMAIVGTHVHEIFQDIEVTCPSYRVVKQEANIMNTYAWFNAREKMNEHYDLSLGRIQRLKASCETQNLDVTGFEAKLNYGRALSAADAEKWEDAYHYAGLAIPLMEAYFAVNPYSLQWIKWKRDLLHEKYAEYGEKSGH